MVGVDVDEARRTSCSQQQFCCGPKAKASSQELLSGFGGARVGHCKGSLGVSSGQERSQGGRSCVQPEGVEVSVVQQSEHGESTGAGMAKRKDTFLGMGKGGGGARPLGKAQTQSPAHKRKDEMLMGGVTGM
jgi:hypothetical protein